MNREEVLVVLRALSPGLVAGEGVMACYLFGNGRVLTYNGVLGLWANSDFGLQAAIPGAKLLEMLTACEGEEVEITQNGDEVLIVSGRAKMRLRTQATTADVDQVLPEDDTAISVDWPEKWTAAIKGVAPAISDDPQRPELMGITVNFGESDARFYATDAITIMRVIVDQEPEPSLVGSSLILPPPYIAVFRGLLDKFPCRGLQFGELSLHTVFYEDDGPQINLVGNFVSDAKPDKYETAISRSGEGLVWAALPAGLTPAIDRAMVVAGSKQYTKVTVSEGKLTLLTEADFGSAKERFPLKGHPDVEMQFESWRLKQALDTADEIAMSSSCIGMRNDNAGMLYLQAGKVQE